MRELEKQIMATVAAGQDAFLSETHPVESDGR